jgi:hypothetical protein
MDCSGCSATDQIGCFRAADKKIFALGILNVSTIVGCRSYLLLFSAVSHHGHHKRIRVKFRY